MSEQGQGKFLLMLITLVVVIALIVWLLAGFDSAAKVAEFGGVAAAAIAGWHALYEAGWLPGYRKRRQRQSEEQRYYSLIQLSTADGKDVPSGDAPGVTEPAKHELAKTLRVVIDAWHNAVTGVEGDGTKPMMEAFLSSYALEESDAIQGKAKKGRRFVVTRFLTYSSAVTTLVTKALEVYPGPLLSKLAF